MQPSGIAWVDEFPTSKEVAHLNEPLRTGVVRFLQALAGAGAQYSIAATYRPKERAYLMHWCCLVAGYRDHDGVWHQVEPQNVPRLKGVDIDWTHGGKLEAARHAAEEMRRAYGIVFPAALESNHTRRLAIDMHITWMGILRIMDAKGVENEIGSPQDGTNPHLAAVGATYGVIKLQSDPPHWSVDGH